MNASYTSLLPGFFESGRKYNRLWNSYWYSRKTCCGHYGRSQENSHQLVSALDSSRVAVCFPEDAAQRRSLTELTSTIAVLKDRLDQLRAPSSAHGFALRKQMVFLCLAKWHWTIILVVADQAYMCWAWPDFNIFSFELGGLVGGSEKM